MSWFCLCVESVLQRRVGELERGGEGCGHTARVEARRVRKERDELKEAACQMENELIQVMGGSVAPYL